MITSKSDSQSHDRKGVMIGAGAVVDRSFGDQLRIAGVPAKVIKQEGEPYHRK